MAGNHAWFSPKAEEKHKLMEGLEDPLDDDDEEHCITSCGPDQFMPELSLVPANILAGMVAGVKLVLGMIVFSSLVFSQDDYPILEDSLPKAMNAFMACAAIQVTYFAVFGTMRFALVTPQDIPAIIFAEIAVLVAQEHPNDSTKILPTIFALMMFASIVCGLLFILMGQLKLTRFLLLMPFPVTGGFLSSVGYSSVKGSFGLMSGAKFYYLWPKDSDAWNDFVEPDAIARMVAGIALVITIRNLPNYLKEKTPKDNKVLRSLWSPIVMFTPLVIFWIIVLAAGISIDELQDKKWLYGDQETTTPYSYWGDAYDFTNYDPNIFFNVDVAINMGVLIMLTVLSAALTISGFELEVGQGSSLDKDKELSHLGFCCVGSGVLAGQVGYHQLGTSLNNRIDGGSHRLSLLSAAIFIIGVWLSGAPISQYVPKWFLGGIYLNIGIVFLKTWVWDSYWKLPLGEYLCIWVAILGTMFTTKIYYGVIIALVFAIVLFVLKMASLDPFRSAIYGDQLRSVVSRTEEEEDVLRVWGRATMIFKLQGPMFFGTVDLLFQTMETSLDGEMSKAGNAKRDTQKAVDSAKHSAKNVCVEYVVVDFKAVSSMDSSAAEQFKKMVETCHASGIGVLFSGMSSSITEVMEREQVWTVYKKEDNIRAVFAQLDEAVEWCENSVLDREIYLGSGGESGQQAMHTRLAEGIVCRTARESGEEMSPERLLSSMGVEVDQAGLVQLVGAFQQQTMKAGDFVYHAGDQPEKLAIVRKGIVQTVDASSDDGVQLQARVRSGFSKMIQEKVEGDATALMASVHDVAERLNVEGAGSVVCEAEFVGKYCHAHDVKVTSATCEILWTTRAKLNELKQNHHEVYGAFMEMVMSEMASDMKTLSRSHVANCKQSNKTASDMGQMHMAVKGRKRMEMLDEGSIQYNHKHSIA